MVTPAQHHPSQRISDILAAPNHPAQHLPQIIRKDSNTKISDTEVNVHSWIQILASHGLPASITPALYYDPKGVGIAAVIGVAAGFLFRFFTTALPHDLQAAAERYATMVNWAKLGTISIQTLAVTGNTVSNIVVPAHIQSAQIYLYAQGVLGGAYLGFENFGILHHKILQLFATPNEPPSDDNDSLIAHTDSPPADTPPEHAQDITIEMGNVIADHPAGPDHKVEIPDHKDEI